MSISNVKQQYQVESYTSSEECLLAELSWVDEIYRGLLKQQTDTNGAIQPLDEFSGMYVSEGQVISHIEDLPGKSVSVLSQPQTHALRANIDQRLLATERSGDINRLRSLRKRFYLSQPEYEILMGCLAPEIDIKFQHYCAYLQNDVMKKRPTAQLLARLVDNSNDELAIYSFLGGSGRLLSSRLLQDVSTENTPMATRQYAPGEAVLPFLLGHNTVSQNLLGCCELVLPKEHELGKKAKRHCNLIADQLQREVNHGRFKYLPYIFGDYGTGKNLLVESIGTVVKRNILRVTPDLFPNAGNSLSTMMSELHQAIVLHNAIVHIDLPATLDSDRAGLQLIANFVAGIMKQTFVILSGAQAPFELDAVAPFPLTSYELALPNLAERAALWGSLMQATPGTNAGFYYQQLAAKFRFSPEQIRSIVDETTDRHSKLLRIDDVYRVCRTKSSQRLRHFARKLPVNFTWDDIALTEETLNQLHEICSQIEHKHKVHIDWGFNSKLSVGQGLNALFVGPSGTGKTMSVEILAGVLGIDVYKINLSCVVSKYVGETEKNLEQIFKEAESCNSILFFDEADAIFGRRSEIKDAHDRYANIEVNYLLQRLDDYKGCVILTTNLKGNLDNAFLRRFAYVVEFPAPDREVRERIWRKVFPESTPLCTDVDVPFLARQFELSGGNIKNIAVNSAFLAARESSDVSMAHLILATKREYKKLGRLCSKSDFGPYLAIARQRQ